MQFINDYLAIPLVQFILGATTTWLVARLYYKRAGDALLKEADSLHKTASALAYRLNHPDSEIEFKRDSNNRITAVMVGSGGKSKGSASVSGVSSDG